MNQSIFASALLTLSNGWNSYTAVAADALGRYATNRVNVWLPATNRFVYDLDGNLRTNGARVFEYDDENQLVRVYEPEQWHSGFVYDGKLRRRERTEAVWDGNRWVTNLLVRYVYDGMLVIQERHYNPQLSTLNPQRTVTYTRGRDLSGGLENAGGIGGLLARTEWTPSTLSAQLSTTLYHSDASGNVTALADLAGRLVGRYWYDPYGNTLAVAGQAAEANLYRFSSKEWHARSGLVYYGYRFYSPEWQRWVNRDPAGEQDRINLYNSLQNNPVRIVDPFGLSAIDIVNELGDGVPIPPSYDVQGWAYSPGILWVFFDALVLKQISSETRYLYDPTVLKPLYVLDRECKCRIVRRARFETVRIDWYRRTGTTGYIKFELLDLIPISRWPFYRPVVGRQIESVTRSVDEGYSMTTSLRRETVPAVGEEVPRSFCDETSCK